MWLDAQIRYNYRHRHRDLEFPLVPQRLVHWDQRQFPSSSTNVVWRQRDRNEYRHVGRQRKCRPFDDCWIHILLHFFVVAVPVDHSSLYGIEKYLFAIDQGRFAQITHLLSQSTQRISMEERFQARLDAGSHFFNFHLALRNGSIILYILKRRHDDDSINSVCVCVNYRMKQMKGNNIKTCN